VKIHIPEGHGNGETLTGVSEVSLKNFLGGSWKPLIDLIASGQIKGLAGVVGCSNLTAGGHDVLTVDLTKELIARDILVLTAGCSSGGIENCGLMTPEAAELAGPNLRAVCKQLGIPPVLNFGPCLAIGRLEIVATEIAEALGVDMPQLPLVLSAAQWLEEQALADGAFGLALGLPLHLGLPPFITGSKVAVKVLTEDMKQLTGGQVIINPDAKSSADQLEAIILEKRAALGL
jgi:carbon-monoxide dehydrogenase catalytic subunit